jgi:hypothetical protein
MKRLEEIVYEAGRDALADQEGLVAGVFASAPARCWPPTRWSPRSSAPRRSARPDSTPGNRSVAEADAGTLGWLAAAGYGYHALRENNATRVTWMSRISGTLGVFMVLQTLAWPA